MENRRVVRVEIEFDNGKVVRVTGEEADKWDAGCRSTAMSAFIHGVNFPEVDWEIVEEGCVEEEDYGERMRAKVAEREKKGQLGQ
jgi:hypothetical protein